MNTAFRESFDADLSAIRDVALLRRIRRVIEQVEAARTFQQIPNLKRWKPAANTIASAWAITGSALCSRKAW